MVFTQTEQAVADMMNDPVKRQKISDFMKTATPDQKTKAQGLLTGISNKIKQEKSQVQTIEAQQKPTPTPQKIFKKKSFNKINPVVDKQWNAQLVAPKENGVPKTVLNSSPRLSNNKEDKNTPPPKTLTEPERNDFVMAEFKQKYWRLPDLFNNEWDKKTAGEMYKNVYNSSLYKQKYAKKTTWAFGER